MYYLIYLKANECGPDKLRYLTFELPSSDELSMSGNRNLILYAWTKSKKIAKKFLSERSHNLFVFEKVDHDPFIEYVKDNYSSLKLGVFKYRTGVSQDDKVSIVSTKYEHNLIEDDAGCIACENLMDCLISDYSILKDKYVTALSLFGYCHIFDLLASDDDGRMALADNNESYNIQSNICNDSCNSSVLTQMSSEFSTFIMQFGFTF